jgi:hypothetical protein
MHAPRKSILDQQRQIAGVVKMRVGQHHRVDGVGSDRERRPIQPELLKALKQPTVDQDTVP